MNLSYIGLIAWLVIATPVAITAGRLPMLFKRDIIVQSHAIFFMYQCFCYLSSISNFGMDGLVAGAYILAVSISFVYTYAFGLRLGEHSTPDALPKYINRSVSILSWAMIPTLAIGTIQLLTGTGRDVGGVFRIYGGTSSPNAFAALILVLLCLLAWSGNPSVTRGRLVLSILCGVLFVACFSMTGFAALLLAVGLYLIIRMHTTKRIKIRLSWLVLGTIAAFALILTAGNILEARLAEFEADDNSLTWRIRTWLMYYEHLSNPVMLLIGGGLGYDHLGMEDDPHNEFIRVIFETGLIGLALFIFIFLRLIKSLRQIIKIRDDNLQKLAAGFLAGLIALLGWGVSDSVLRTAPSVLLVWAAAGLLNGLARSHIKHKAQK